MHPAFTVSPSYCPTKYEYNWTMLTGDKTAITQGTVDKKQFSFFYNESLDPVSESQTVTVSVTTDSIYPSQSTQKLTENEEFTLTFKNPCFDTEYVEIVAPTLANYDYIVYSLPA